MTVIIHPNLAYLFILAAVMLALTSLLFPRTKQPKIWLVLCLVAAGFELSQMRANPWALILTAFSPLPYYLLLRRERFSFVLLGLTVTLLTVGSTLTVVDETGKPAVTIGLAVILSTFCGLYLWMAARRAVLGPRPVIDDPAVGMLGEALTEIDDFGQVLVNGESVPARSKEHIPAGSTVRVLRSEGRVLVVKKAEGLSIKASLPKDSKKN